MRRLTALLVLVLAFVAGYGLTTCDAHAQTGKGAAPAGIQTTGGPDSYGYTFKDSLETGCGYNWSSIVGLAGTTNLNFGDDTTSTAQSLGFTFTFYGNSYTTAYVNANGFVTFDSIGSGYYTNECSPWPTTSTPNNMIAGVWDDLYPTTGGADNVYFKSFAAGSCPGGRTQACAIFEWNNVEYLAAAATVTFQIILRSDNVVEVQLNTVGMSGSSSSTGTQNSGGTIGLLYYRSGTGCNQANSVLGTSAVYFLPPGTTSCNPAAVTATPTPAPTATPTPSGSVGGFDVAEQLRPESPAADMPTTDSSRSLLVLALVVAGAVAGALYLGLRRQ